MARGRSMWVRVLTIACMVMVAGTFPLTGSAQDTARDDDTSAQADQDNSAQADQDNSAPAEQDNSAPAEQDNSAPAEQDNTVDLSFEIEEIVVEGTRGFGIKEVPISVTQFGASDLQNLRIQNVADLSAYTPNLEINTAFAASNPTLFIRGVGLKDYNSNSTGAVGIWHDGVVMNSPMAQLFSIYDIESIEILRGPIGGLDGRNSTAGGIRLHSFKPNGEWSASGSFTYGNLNELAFEGSVGFPIFPELFDDRLSGRFAAVTEFRDPYTDNVCANWNPEEYGLLTSTEEFTRTFYAKLDPSSVKVVTSSGSSDTPSNVKPRFIYQDFAAVQEFNDKNIGQNLNVARLLDGPGGTPGTRVGVQKAKFSIASDNVCLLRKAGNLITHEGAGAKKPEGTFEANNDAIPLSQYQGLHSKYNDIKYWGTRGQILFQATDTIDFLAKVHWGQNRSDSLHAQTLSATSNLIDSDGAIVDYAVGYHETANSSGWSENFADFAPFEKPKARDGLNLRRDSDARGFAGNDPFSGFYSHDGKEKLDLFGATLTGNFEFDWGRIKAIVNYEEAKRDLEDEGDACPCTPLLGFLEDETYQLTPTLSATYEGENFWVKMGAFYLYEELDSNNYYPSSLRFALDQTYEQTTNTWNIGSDFHYDFLEEDEWTGFYQLSLDAGFRYNWERKDFTLGTTFLKLETGAQKESIPEESVSGQWDAITGQVVLNYQPIESARAYLKYTRGFKAGHFNAGITTQPKPNSRDIEALQSLDPVDPEYVDAIEFGLRSKWFDDRVELSGAVFRYWYKDMQVFDIVNEEGAIPTQQLLNADADVIGAEIELTLRPLEGLMIETGFSWLDTEYGEFLVTKTTVPPSGLPPRPGVNTTFNYEGNQLIAAPKFTWSGYIEYELPLFHWGKVIPAFDFSYKSRTYQDPQEEELLSQEPFWLLNGRLSYRTPGGSIEVAGWVQNFLDEVYIVDSFDTSRQFQSILEIYAEPRTYGVTLSYLW